MRVASVRRLLLVPLIILASACGDDTQFTNVQPSAPPTVVSVTFSGTLTRNAAFTHTFPVTDSGDVSVFLLSSIDARNPENNAVPIGVSLGTWNGQSCSIVIASDNTTPVSTDDPLRGKLTGRATAAGNLCVRVYDVGYVPSAANYELLIDHY